MAQSRGKALKDAKAFLMKRSNEADPSIYEHMSAMVEKILTIRPDNALDSFNQISDDLRQHTFAPGTQDVVKEFVAVPGLMDCGQKEISAIQGVLATHDDPGVEDDAFEDPVPDMMERAIMFDAAGVGLGMEETYRVYAHLKALPRTRKFLENIRFFGKIMGTSHDYYVAEANIKDGEEEEGEVDVFGKPVSAAPEEVDEDGDADESPRGDEPQPADTFSVSGDNGSHFAGVPPLNPPRVIDVPLEITGEGVNVKIYYICRNPGEDWRRLPNATPKMISTARQLRRYFTGDVDAPVHGYPQFPGKEGHYLRAQIGRIAAATNISPLGFYKTPDDEEEGDGGEERTPDRVEANDEYEAMGGTELSESLANWVHNVKYILPQGRCTFFNPMKGKGEDFEDDGEEEDEERGGDEAEFPMEAETGPLLLNPVSDDGLPGLVAAWSIRRSSNIFPHQAHAVVRSNIWPGACSVGNAKLFENIYIGFGHKYQPEGFSPALPPPQLDEFSPEIAVKEIADPTPAEEEAMRKNEEDKEDDEEDEEGDEDEGEEDDD